MLLFGGTFEDPSQQHSCFLLRIDAHGQPTSWAHMPPDAALPHPIGMAPPPFHCEIQGHLQVLAKRALKSQCLQTSQASKYHRIFNCHHTSKRHKKAAWTFVLFPEYTQSQEVCNA